MKISLKHVVWISVLSSFVCLSCWLLFRIIFTNEPTTTHTSGPSAILTNVTSITYDASGQIKNHLFSKKLTYFSDTKKAIFEKPNLIVYNANHTPWFISANQGISLNGNNILQLIGNVNLVQQLGPNNPQSTIVTQALTVFPNKHMAETKLPVTYTQISRDHSKMIVNSVGAIAYQKTGEIKLLSQARGVYDPKS